jgi:phage head maturation protease
MMIAPRGWSPDRVEKRFALTKPTSYDETGRTVDAIISRGSDVQRFYGTERLRIDRSAVVIDRLMTSGIPVLDSHQQTGISNALGRVQTTWISDGCLMGRLAFNETREGRKAEGMVARGEISGVSAGYRVLEWEVTDEDGKVIDPDGGARWDDALTYEAIRWELLECSLVAVAADAGASIRSLSGDDRDDVINILVRMQVRDRMARRQRMYEVQQAVFSGRQ